MHGLLNKTKLDPGLIDEIIWGNVVIKSAAPNIAREIIIDLHLPQHITGTTCSKACLSGLQAVEQAVMLVEQGGADVVIAGGSDSISSGELTMPRDLTLALDKYSLGGGNKKGWKGVKEIFETAGPPSAWFPRQNSIAERSTGKTMGYHADLMAEINSISREEQERFAIASHAKAHKARQEGILGCDIVPVMSKHHTGPIAQDDLIRPSMDANKIAHLGTAFRKPSENGSITAATSSALTDGASAVLIMSEEMASKLGYPTDITLKSFANTAIDPFPQLLLAPAIAIPKALDRAGLSLQDIDLVEIHEAFAAQVLATLKCLESESFCKSIGRKQALGRIDPNKINVYGGSLAIGHPFAATGGRIVTTAANALRRTKSRYCLISICAAGGLGGVAILERHE